jgi:hypothetical protein
MTVAINFSVYYCKYNKWLTKIHVFCQHN